MKEKYKDNELESLKKGIEEGWLFNDEDENESWYKVGQLKKRPDGEEKIIFR